MSTTSFDTHLEPCWQPYLQAIMFALPAVIAWGFACVMLVPKVKEICLAARLEPAKVGWLWDAPLFLVQHGRSIGIASILILVLLELFVRGWARHRRVTVSILVWVVNAAVIVGLITLLILVLIAAPSLSHAK